MWIDRFTGERINRLPEAIESGRYLAVQHASSQQKLNTVTGSLLVDHGVELPVIDDRSSAFALPPKALEQKIELFEQILETIDPSIVDNCELVSPLMPEGVVNESSFLNSFEKKLLEIINAGHFHQISLRPRLDLHYEDEVTDVARAKKLAKGALVHLASHSECWQRQTLSGVVPKRVKARFSEDDFNIYENQVYARLMDKIEKYLNWRVATLRQLQIAVSDALEFYGTIDLHHRLTEEICSLWGKAFTQKSTSKASEHLADTLDQLDRALGIVRGLKQRGLYLLVNRYARIGNGLHLTNILSHDQHYRHLPVLWNELNNIVSGKQKTPAERKEHNEWLNRAYSRYAGLVLRHALTPYLGVKLSSTWAGLNLELRQVGLNWQLIILPADSFEKERVLLEIVPWMGFVVRPEHLHTLQSDKKKYQPLRMLAWPNLSEDGLYSNQTAAEGAWIQLSPFDLYGVERYGRLVDQILQRELVSGYGCALIKVPDQSIGVAKQVLGLEVTAEKHEIKVIQALSPEDFIKLERSLVKENASGQARQLKKRHEEIIKLQECPVCSAVVRVIYQQPFGFVANCLACKTQRYLRSDGTTKKFEQSLAGLSEFKLVGRRSFVCKI